MNRHNELNLIKKTEKRNNLNYTKLVWRHFTFLFDWYELLNKHWFSDIAFFKNEYKDFVFIERHRVNSTPCLLVDTPVKTYLFYFYITVGEQVKSMIYEVDFSTKNKQATKQIIKDLKEENFERLTPVFTYDKHGIILDYPINYHYFDFIKYLLTFEVPITKDKIVKVTRTSDLEQYKLLRFNEII